MSLHNPIESKPLREHRGLDIKNRGVLHRRAQDLYDPLGKGAPPGSLLSRRAVRDAEWMMELPAANNAVGAHACRHGK